MMKMQCGKFILVAVLSIGLRMAFLEASPPSQAAPANAQTRSTVAGLNAIGVDILASGGAQATKYLDLLSATGVGWVRISANWSRIETRQGQFNWTTLDAAVDGLRSRNIQILMTVSRTPCWAREDVTTPCFTTTTNDHHDGSQIPNKDHWQKFLTLLAQRYKGRVSNFEIWNEPNLAASVFVSGATDNSELLLSAYRDKILIPAAEALHAVAPNIRVAGPVIGAFGKITTEEFAQLLKTSLDNGAAQMIDIVSVHLYPPNQNVLDYGRAARSVMRSFSISRDPLWLTEFGLPARSGTNQLLQSVSDDRENAQAKYLSTALEDNATKQYIFNKMFWYAFADTDIFKPTPNDSRRFGLINNDLTERPVYKALRAYTSEQN